MPVSPVHKIGELIDLSSMHGIEIGALHTPRLPRDHPNVRYLDHATREELQAKYRDNPEAAPQADKLVHVDYVWQPGMRLIDALGGDAPVDFVIASHVIEHIPDPIGWLAQISEILADGGILSLVVPDRRFTFDVNRPETTTAELVDLFLRGRQLPTFQQIYSHESAFVGSVDAQAVWEGLDLSATRREDVGDPDQFALERARSSSGSEAYVDVHCSVFTPDSFLRRYQDVVRLGFVDLEVVRFYTTDYGHYEFFVTLRKVAGASTDDRERLARSAEPFIGLAPELPPEPEPEPEPEVDPDALAPEALGDDRFSMNLSGLEVRAVEAKRAATRRTRAAVAALRSQVTRGPS
jgi:SAM-dependent methyltransferase